MESAPLREAATQKLVKEHPHLNHNTQDTVIEMDDSNEVSILTAPGSTMHESHEALVEH